MGWGCRDPLDQQDLAHLGPGPQDTGDPRTYDIITHQINVQRTKKSIKFLHSELKQQIFHIFA